MLIYLNPVLTNVYTISLGWLLSFNLSILPTIFLVSAKFSNRSFLVIFPSNVNGFYLIQIISVLNILIIMSFSPINRCYQPVHDIFRILFRTKFRMSQVYPSSLNRRLTSSHCYIVELIVTVLHLYFI